MISYIRRPMFFAALIAVCFTTVAYFERKLSLILAVLAVIISLAIFIFSKRKDVFFATLFVVAVMIVLLSVNRRIDRFDLLDGSYAHEEFVATSDCEFFDDYSSVEVKCVSGSTIPKGSKITAYYYGDETIICGSRFNASAKIKKFSNGEKKRFAFSEGRYVSCTLSKIELLNTDDAFYGFIGKVRRYIRRSVYEYTSGDTAGAMIAMLSGDKSHISEELSANVKASGVSHIMVVSGMHLAIFMNILLLLIRRITLNKYIRFFFMLSGVLFIVAVCGFTMSILRAGIMFILAGMAPILNRENDSLNTLSSAVLFIMLFTPFAALNISFELSVLATYAVIEIVPFYSELVCKKFNSRILSGFVSTVFIALFAAIITSPVTLSTFDSASLSAPITNIFITYAVTAAVSVTAVGIIIPNIPVLSFIRCLLLKLAGLLSKYIVFIINMFGELPLSRVKPGKAALYLFVLLNALIIGFMYFYRGFIEKRIGE